ncbi:TonB-dependent receptor [Spongiibacter sp. KMU-166]|uniref:TonB-dependent receptor n=1 Tax=Spongiibacter thalassae TaxID=2721624 RepID=A0ABX1G9Z1_9GAMM|nr:TonB-dependent receptor [Spongiibacter thalassae]NKI15979.1 TonB-dependent receptor [Spongiibacter thalassae]
MKTHRVLLSSVLAFSLTPLDALSQMLEEVVVTARKRDESLMDTTYSVSAISGEELDAFGSSNFNNIAESTPNLDISKSPTGVPSVSMRGIGTISSLNPFDMTVGLAINGQFYTNAQWFQSGLFDIQQIEVLRGPQGVDFGKNTTAGLINVMTRRPGQELEASLRTSYEPETEEQLFEVAIAAPLTERIAGRIAAQRRKNTGYQQTYLGKNSPNLTRDLLRTTLTWAATDNLSVAHIYFHSDFEEVGIGSELMQCDPTYRSFLGSIGSTDDCQANDVLYEGQLIGGITAQPLYQRGIDNSGKFGELSSHTLALEAEFSRLSVTSTTGYQTLDTYSGVDTDYTNTEFIDAGFPDKSRTISQEIRVDFNEFNKLTPMLGIYYESQNRAAGTFADFRLPNVVAEILLPAALLDTLSGLTLDGAGFSSAASLETTSDTFAVFGDVTWEITSALSLNFGARYNIESKDALYNQISGDLRDPQSNERGGKAVGTFIGRTDINNLKGTREVEYFHPSATLQWDYYELLTDYLDSAQLYLTYKEGYKSGGFESISGVDANGEPAQEFEFDDETVDGIEVGTKIEAFNGRMRLSLAAFQSNYTNLQLQYLPSSQFTLIATNAGSATTEGFESDWQLALTEQLWLSIAYAYTVAEYETFADAPCYGGQTESEGCTDGVQDLSGQGMANAPKNTGSAGMRYRGTVLDSYSVNASVQASYTDDALFDAFGDPNTYRDAFMTVNGNLSFGSINESWTISLIGRNLTNERNLSFKATAPLSSLLPTFENPSYFGALAPPRTIAAQLTLKY